MPKSLHIGVCVYMYVYMCVHIYVYVYFALRASCRAIYAVSQVRELTDARIPSSWGVYIRVHMYMYLYICMYMYVCMCTFRFTTFMYILLHLQFAQLAKDKVPSFWCVNMYAYTYIYVNICIHVYVHFDLLAICCTG